MINKHFFSRTLLLLLLLPMLILAACSDSPSKQNGGEDDEVDFDTKGITSFGLKGDKNGLSNDIMATLGDDGRTFVLTTQKWLGNVETLIPTFKAEYTITVAGAVQMSGTSPVDLSKEIIYTATAKDNSTRDYRVILKSPQSTGLPVFNIVTHDGQDITSKEKYKDANISIANAPNKDHNMVTTTEIRGRGNSTWAYPKKPYRLKFHKKTSLFGLTSAKSWVLIANYQDPSLITGTVSFELGNRIQLPYTNHSTHVEVFLNHTYRGSYMLTEQVQVGKGRVDVDEQEGFLVELDTYYDEEPKFKTNIFELPIMIKSPKDVPIDFVKQAFDELDAALSNSSFPNSGYYDMLDIETVIDYLIINEMVRNQELQHPKSGYAYKDKGGKIGFGPLWDFDWAYGYSSSSKDYFNNANNMILGPNYTGGATSKGYRFYRKFFDDPRFLQQYKARWNEHYPIILEMESFIGELGKSLEKSSIENGIKWNTETLDYPNHISNMQNWWRERAEYLNTEINKY